jgi:hypothetical protein
LAATHLFKVAKLTIHDREEKVWLSGFRHSSEAARLFCEQLRMHGKALLKGGGRSFPFKGHHEGHAEGFRNGGRRG